MKRENDFFFRFRFYWLTWRKVFFLTCCWEIFFFLFLLSFFCFLFLQHFSLSEMKWHTQKHKLLKKGKALWMCDEQKQNELRMMMNVVVSSNVCNFILSKNNVTKRVIQKNKFFFERRILFNNDTYFSFSFLKLNSNLLLPNHLDFLFLMILLLMKEVY